MTIKLPAKVLPKTRKKKTRKEREQALINANAELIGSITKYQQYMNELKEANDDVDQKIRKVREKLTFTHEEAMKKVFL